MNSVFSYYKDAYLALESFDQNTDIAIESLNGDMQSIAEDLNPKLMDASGRYNAAIHSGDYDSALKALNELESVVKTWKSRLNALPAEAISKTIIRTTVKMASVLVSCIFIINSRTIRNFVKTWIMSHGGKEWIAKFISSGINFAVGGEAFSTIFKAISGLFLHLANTTGGDKSQYKDDPNRHNGTYIAAQVGLDTWLKNVETAKNEIRKIQTEEKAK